MFLSPFWQNITDVVNSRRCNLEAIILESSHFCQPLFEGNFTITLWRGPNCRSGMTTVLSGNHNTCMKC